MPYFLYILFKIIIFSPVTTKIFKSSIFFLMESICKNYKPQIIWIKQYFDNLIIFGKDLTEFIVWNIKGLRRFVAKI